MIKRYHLGCPMWAHKLWLGEFYAERTRSGDYLQNYASVFNTVEGNTTFYAAPRPDTIARWAEQTPEGFRFTFKFPKTVTHERKLVDTEEEALAFIELLQPLESRLGPFFVGLPATFGLGLLDVLITFLSRMPEGLRFAVEFRHPAFFGPVEATANEQLAAVGADRIHFHTEALLDCPTTDPDIIEAKQKKPPVPYRDEALGRHPFVRYVGPPDSAQNEPHLDRWAQVVSGWIDEGREPYFFVHHPPSDVYAPRLARYFHQKLSTLVDAGEMHDWPIDVGRADQLDLF
tara:strand:- start:4108 stop:4971 length:864 start_codon:yes stop_codon:yes gene_type:complete